MRDEAVELLQALIRLDTVNPPGNETQAAELLRSYLEPFGVECELYARVPERANLVARIRGTGEGPSTAAALAHRHRACRPGRVVGRPVVGRAERRLRLGPGRARHEEPGGGERGRDRVAGARGIPAERRPDLRRDRRRGDGRGRRVRPRVALRGASGRGALRLRGQRGAGDRVEIGGRVLYLCSSAEKRSSPFTLRVHGRSGHGSMPGIADNALVKAAGYIERLGAFAAEPVLTPETEGFLRALADRVPPAEEALAAARAIDPVAAEMIEPLLGLTVAPTMVEASAKRNVIPGRCEVTVDCRLLPGADRGGRRARAAAMARRGRLRARVARRAGRDALGARHAALVCDRDVRRRSSSRERGLRRSASLGSPTRTGSARRSGRSRTGSSRCGRCRPRSPRVSSTPPTSGSPSTTSSSGCSSSATWPSPSRLFAWLRQDSSRRDGAAERRAGARADRLGGRGADAGRASSASRRATRRCVART